MGWGSGKSWDGRDIGYLHDAVCDQEGCDEEIDRGLAYLCGDLDQVLHNSGVGCGKYFCGSHLFVSSIEGVSLCDECLKRHNTLILKHCEKTPFNTSGLCGECPVCGDEVESIAQPEADNRIGLEEHVLFTPFEEKCYFILQPCGHEVDTVELKR